MTGEKDLAHSPNDTIRLLAITTLLLTGCASGMHSVPVRSEALQQCIELFHDADRAVASAGVRDGGDFRIAGYPYLRIGRFDASLSDRIDNEATFSAWVERLADRDRQARAIELNNLPASGLKRLGRDIGERLDGCRKRLVSFQFKSPGQRRKLIDSANVPDDYLTWQRVAGLYPVSALFVASGVARWHDDERRTYATPLAELPVRGHLIRFGSRNGQPLPPARIAAILKHSAGPLGIPAPNHSEQKQLFDSFAPIWEVDVAGTGDRVGMPAWSGGKLAIDTTRPAIFRRLSYTRYRGDILLQLNYIVWFPSRDSGDIYGGDIDGINWRVTLGTDGKVLLFDSIHNCGCYQKFYPGKRLRLRSDFPRSYFEAPVAPQPAPQSVPEGGPVTLRISHANHFIQRAYIGDGKNAVPLTVHHYDMLRSLPHGSSHRSIFNEEGIVQQSERPERFILWPMGVRSAGAMRQWGRHNTAFVGKRHFDDPDLIELLFETVEP